MLQANLVQVIIYFARKPAKKNTNKNATQASGRELVA